MHSRVLLLRVLTVACHLPLEAFLAQAHQYSLPVFL